MLAGWARCSVDLRQIHDSSNTSILQSGKSLDTGTCQLAGTSVAYRDSRINRIFEGTNEINRLLIPGMLFKRAMRGQIPLVAAAQKVMGEIISGPPAEDLVANAKKVALLMMGVAYQKHLTALEQQQEILM